MVVSAAPVLQPVLAVEAVDEVAALKLVVATTAADALAAAGVWLFFLPAAFVMVPDLEGVVLPAGTGAEFIFEFEPYRSRNIDMFMMELMKRCLLPSFGGGGDAVAIVFFAAAGDDDADADIFGLGTSAGTAAAV